MSNTESELPEDRLELYDKLIESNPDIERKGVSMPYTSVNGHMFSHLDKSGTMGLRLPKEEREAFLEKYDTTPFEQHGAIMKEYVTVPDELLQNTDTLSGYLEISYRYVGSLKPKPTRAYRSRPGGVSHVSGSGTSTRSARLILFSAIGIRMSL